MREYHFLVSSLPELFFNKKNQLINIESFFNELEKYLHPDDFKIVKCLRYETDNTNILNLLADNNKVFIEGGNYTISGLEAEIKSPENLPNYLIEFISYFNKEGESIDFTKIEKHLFNLYYDYVINLNNSFLQNHLIKLSYP